MPPEDQPLLEIKRYFSDKEKPLHLQIFGEEPEETTKPSSSMLSFTPKPDSKDLDIRVRGEDRPQESGDLPPLFFEESTYQLHMTIPPSEDHLEYSLKTDSGLKEENYSWVGPNNHFYSGTFNTESRVGIAKFKVARKDEVALEFELEVFPSKMDYRDDFMNMIDEIISITYELAIDFDKFTKLRAKSTDQLQPTEEVWFTILEQLFGGLIEAFHVVARNPKRRFTSIQRKVAPAKVRRSAGDLRKWVSRNQTKLQKTDDEEGLVNFKGEQYSVKKLPEKRKVNSVDTVENRFLKQMLRQIKTKLRKFKNKYKSYTGGSSSRNRDEELLNKMSNMRDKVTRLQEYDFIKEASRLRKRNFSSNVLQMAPGYKTIYKHYFLLQKGLELKGEPFKLSPKDTAELYEYWCYLKVVQLLKDNDKPNLELTSDDLVQVTSEGIRLNLSDTDMSEVIFQEKKGDKFRLYYNWSDSKSEDFATESEPRTFNYSFFQEGNDRNFQNNPTGENRPDIMLEMVKHDPKSSERYPAQLRFLFDAKYKQGERNNVTGPKTEDINTMHRYRDAIISKLEDLEDPYASKYIRKTINALVLFPLGGEYQGEKIKKYQNNHDFFRSIGEVGIGGLPFLPGTTNLVDAILNDWIEYHPEQFRDRRIRQLHPDEIEWYNERYKDVLVGVMPDHGDQLERWRLITKENFYHMPASEANQRRLSVDYLAFYFPKGTNKNLNNVNFSKGHIKYYAQVKNTEIVKRKDIPLPSSGSSSGEEPYVKYILKPPLRELDEPIFNSEGEMVTFRFGTLYTLKRARILPELYITNPSMQKKWRDIQQSDEDKRPYIRRWEKEEDGNYRAIVDFKK